MKKINLFKKKVYTPEEQIRNDRIKAIVYIASFFILVVLFRVFGQNPQINVQDQEVTITDTVLKLLDKYKKNNYEVNINIVKDKEMINVVKRMQDKDTEIFYIKYRGNESIYFKNKENYFVVDGENVTKTNKYDKIFDYDETFLDINNLINLLENSNKYYKDLKEEKYLIRRYKIPLTEVLKIYNEINGTEEFTSIIKEISIDIKYLKDEIIGISMNMLYLNNYLKEANDTTFTYDLTFRDLGVVDLKELVEVTNNL